MKRGWEEVWVPLQGSRGGWAVHPALQDTVGRSSAGESTLCTGWMGNLLVGQSRSQGSWPELPRHHPSSSKPVLQGQCEQSCETALSTKSLCATAGCTGSSERERRGLCAAYSFVLMSCCCCSALLQPLAPASSPELPWASLSSRKQGSCNVSCAISQGHVPVTTLKAAKGWGAATPSSDVRMGSI